jgi:hypothetical protein
MSKNIMGYDMLSDTRELDCDNGHKLCYCAGRAECHNCGVILADDYKAKPTGEGENNV